MPNISVRVAASAGDAEQSASGGGVAVTGNSLDMGSTDGNSHVGFNFQNVTVPQGAIINECYLEFVCYGSTSGSMDLDIYGEDVDNAAAFSTTTNNISGRTLTTAKVDWAPAAWTIGNTYQTLDLSTIAQEIVDRGGWASGNAMTFIVVEMASSDRRRAISYDNTPASAPLLYIDYTVAGGSSSQEITVSAGADDAEEVGWSGEMDTTGTNASMGEYYTAMRFQAVNVPPGATISLAEIDFVASGDDSGACNVDFHCQDIDDAGAFTSTAGDISDRARTSAAVTWANIPAWTSLGVYTSPNLAAIFQEVIDRPGWAAGQDIVVITLPDDSGARRRWRTEEAATGAAPTLRIEWTEDLGSAVVHSLGYGKDTVVAEARQSAPAILSQGYSLDTVVASVDATEVVHVTDFGISVDTVFVSVDFSVVVVDRGLGLDAVFVPVEAIAVITDLGYGLDTVSAIVALQSFTGALSRGQSIDTVVAILATQSFVTILSVGQSRDVVIATVVIGQPVNLGLEPPGIVTGIVHQLDILYRSVFDE